uniref:c-type cytochrome n=1 Tax=Neisseria meningitidis TaxID=487 RepID=UPI001F0C97D5
LQERSYATAYWPFSVRESCTSNANPPSCKMCHGGTIPGASAVGKKEDWAPRIAKGKETLHKHAIEGFNAMPAKGGNAGLSDDEVKAAVDYMANQSGATF